LVDRVFPEVPVRQWVPSVPFALRYRLAYDSSLVRDVFRILVRAVFASIHRRASIPASNRRARCGAVTFIQRFSDALNLDPHFHAPALDGLYVEGGRGKLVFWHVRPPGDAELARVADRVRRSVPRLMERRGLGPQADPDEDTLRQDAPLLAELYGASVSGRMATGPLAGRRVARVGDAVDMDNAALPSGRCCAAVEGYSVRAGVCVPARDRMRLERLARYSGVLAPAWAFRSLLVPQEEAPSPAAHAGCQGGVATAKTDSGKAKEKCICRPRNYPWAQLMARVFEFDVLQSRLWGTVRAEHEVFAAIRPVPPLQWGGHELRRLGQEQRRQQHALRPGLGGLLTRGTAGGSTGQFLCGPSLRFHFMHRAEQLLNVSNGKDVVFLSNWFLMVSLVFASGEVLARPGLSHIYREVKPIAARQPGITMTSNQAGFGGSFNSAECTLSEDFSRGVRLKLDPCGANYLDEQITGNRNGRAVSDGRYFGSGHAGSLHNFIQRKTGFLDDPDSKSREFRLVFHQCDIAGRQSKNASQIIRRLRGYEITGFRCLSFHQAPPQVPLKRLSDDYRQSFSLLPALCGSSFGTREKAGSRSPCGSRRRLCNAHSGRLFLSPKLRRR
jgi:hypothetical protein